MKEVFLSYHHDDKKIAAEVKAELEKAGLTSFLAHDDIEVSKVWRDEILKHLDSCSALIAIVTANFRGSVWVNQEVGAVMAKKKPIVSLIFAQSERLPGFLEMFQGIHVSTINDVVSKSLEAIAKGPESEALRQLPLFAKAIEQHTLDHRELARKFIESMPGPYLADEYRDLVQFLTGTWQQIYPYEHEALFADIKNHDSSGILDKWEEWKSKNRDYVKERASIFKEIADKLTEFVLHARSNSFELCLSETPLSSKPRQLNPVGVALVYGTLISNYVTTLPRFSFDYDVASRSARIQDVDGRVEYVCNMGKLLSALNDQRDLLQAAAISLMEIVRDIVTLDWVSETRIDAVLTRRQELETLRSEILKLFNGYRSFPLLPGKCRFVDASAKLDGLLNV